ncbi:MAG: hypothetical protein Q7T05_04755, partial [Dehalococcoidia bacterium]|nr:hypothetical protein [Dehalococcoidia bacterium]
TDQVDNRRGKSTGIVVSVRLAPEDSGKLVDLAEESGKTVSQVAREAIRAFISQDRQHPKFVPEITGSTLGIDISAFVPLGPRTVNDGAVIVSDETLKDETLPPVSRTGRILAVA